MVGPRLTAWTWWPVGGCRGENWQAADNAGVKLGERGLIKLTGEQDHEQGTPCDATRPIAVLLADQTPGLGNQVPTFPGPLQIYGPRRGQAVAFCSTAPVRVRTR